MTPSVPAENDVFQRYSAYYDLLYRGKDYESEADYVARTLHASAPAAQAVLEFGSGTGRHGRLLAQRGFDVFGVERSESMVSIAKASPSPTGRGSFNCVQGDIRTAQLGRTFDAVLSLFHVVSYQTRNQDLQATFSNAVRHLVRGGVFFFDVWHGPAVLTERPSTRHKTVEDADTRLNRVAESTLDEVASVVTVRYTMVAESKRDGSTTTFHEEHHMRYLFPTEIDLLARSTGFAVERMEEFGTGLPASLATWGVAYVLRKTGG